MTLTKTGYAVQLTRKDGTKFLSCGTGMLPRVEHLRKYAVKLKRELKQHGFKARVVTVRYAEPVVVE